MISTQKEQHRMNSLVDSIFGRRLNPTHPCAWCRKPIGHVEHHPIPVCRACFLYAYENSLPPQSQFARLMDEFRKEATIWAKRIQDRPSMAGMSMVATEIQIDVLSMSREALRLAREGKTKEADELRARIEAGAKKVQGFRDEQTGLIKDLDSDD